MLKKKEVCEVNEKFQKFIKMYNNGEIDYTNTILDDVYELLEKKENVKSKTQAIMYFRQYDLLVGTIPTIDYYILENSKKKK